MKKVVRGVGLSLGAVTLMVGGLTAPAQAANPPNCVTATLWSASIYDYTRADNHCSSSQRFYFQWDYALDGWCSSLPSGYSRTESRGSQAIFRSFVSC